MTSLSTKQLYFSFLMCIYCLLFPSLQSYWNIVMALIKVHFVTVFMKIPYDANFRSKVLFFACITPRHNLPEIYCYITLLTEADIFPYSTQLCSDYQVQCRLKRRNDELMRSLMTLIWESAWIQVSDAIFFPGLFCIIFSHFCSALVVWGLGSWIGFLRLGFSVDGVWGLW